MAADPITLTAILAGIAYVSGKVRIIQATGLAGWRKIVDEISEGIFKTWLPPRAKLYGDMILRVSKEQGVDPFILFALGDRETNWGAAAQYRQQTGDWGPRRKLLSYVQSLGSAVRILGTDMDAESGQVYASYEPSDGLGWGRGIAQIDWEMQPWTRTSNWRDDYVNLSYGAKLLQGHLVYFAAVFKTPTITISNYTAKRLGVVPGSNYPDVRPLKGQPLIAAALSAYNAGRMNVLAALAVGKPADYLTTDNYATDTLKRANVLASNFDKNGGKAV